MFFAASLACPVDAVAAAGAIATGAVTGIIVEPDGTDARIVVAVDRAFHYEVDRRGDRVVIRIDPASAVAADHTLTIGPVRSLRVRPIADVPPRAEITVVTAEPVRAADSFIDGGALVVALRTHPAPISTVNPPRSLTGAVPRREAVPPDELPQTRRVAGRILVARTLTLDEGTGRLLDLEHVTRVAVSDPRIVGAVPVSLREVLVSGRAAGRATVYLWDGRERLLSYAVEVRAADDPYRGLRRALAALLPNAAITITEARGGQPLTPPAGPAYAAAADPAPQSPLPQPAGPAPAAARSDSRAVVLSGMVETQVDRAKAEDVARAFVPAVVNLLTVRRPVQLSLQVEVVELDRSAQKSLGIVWGGGQQVPGSPPSLNGGVYNLQVLTAPGLSVNGLDLLLAQLEALSQRGEARLLARPRLAVLAGRTASLLLGGQVPVPVAGANGTVTVEYKDFGVILAVRPEYQDDGRLFLQITPEVSTLDFTNAIRVSGFEIPALSVRRAQTVVALRPGETLVLGGLLQREDVVQAQKVPVLADLPVIGALFRSKSFQHRDSDLLILVTPQLVDTPQTP
ncbi:MAG TPA: pilus assembly protein N-terminal domain-containing protein [bacterium]|nr:pilus assembly protein N-terminal domain-containing protein [bacterium]